jgi:hypothetical protein
MASHTSHGQQIMEWSERIAAFSEPAWAEKGQLTVTYLTPAHLQTAQALTQLMQEAGFDEVSTDAVGNVVGRYHGVDAAAPALMTGSHYDTVRNGDLAFWCQSLWWACSPNRKSVCPMALKSSGFLKKKASAIAPPSCRPVR